MAQLTQSHQVEAAGLIWIKGRALNDWRDRRRDGEGMSVLKESGRGQAAIYVR